MSVEKASHAPAPCYEALEVFERLRRERGAGLEGVRGQRRAAAARLQNCRTNHDPLVSPHGSSHAYQRGIQGLGLCHHRGGSVHDVQAGIQLQEQTQSKCALNPKTAVQCEDNRSTTEGITNMHNTHLRGGLGDSVRQRRYLLCHLVVCTDRQTNIILGATYSRNHGNAPWSILRALPVMSYLVSSSAACISTAAVTTRM